jgi:MFS transporter, ACS family, D-galactonate transporter
MPTFAAAQRKGIPGPLSIVLGLLAVSVFINYIDRGNLSIAAPYLKDELGISATQLGILLSAFFYTYACLQPVAGWLVDRFNVNCIFAGGFFLWSAATASTGLVHTFAALFILRLLLGVGESVAYPSYCKIFTLHFPEEHRGLANSVLSAGAVLGPGFGIIFGGVLMGRFGWRPFFIILGLASLLWLVPWLKWMPKKPPACAAEVGAQSTYGANTNAGPTVSEFVLLRSAWGSCIGLFCYDYVVYFLITWLPFFLMRERNFSANNMAKIGGVAYLCGACSATLCGWLSDRWIMSGGTPTLVRKTFTAGGLALAGVFVGLAAFGGKSNCIAALILGVTCFGISSSNIWAITQTLAGPEAAGRWTGYQNFVGNLSGVVAPTLTGFVLDRTGHFYWAFAILTFVAMAGTACWIFVVGPVEQVVWREPSKAEELSV